MKNAILILLLLYSCTKEQVPQSGNGNCKEAWLISLKYTKDTILLKTDTIWHDYICGKWLDTIQSQKPYWILFCSPPHPNTNPSFILEFRKYVVRQF